MPGRKRADGNAPIRRRTRTGCKSCRDRKVKCDETKPVCRNCSSRGLACNSGLQLKWHEEFASRGIAFGRQGVWTKDPARGSASNPLPTISNDSNQSDWLSVPEIRSHHFLHAGLSDFETDDSGPERSDLVVEPEAEEGTKATSADLSSCIVAYHVFQGSFVPRQLAPFSTSIDFDSGLFEYYLRKLCPLTTTSRTSSSPFAQLIPPLLAHAGHDDVLQSLLAFSARHRSIADPRWSHKAMSLKGGVLASLQKRLSASDTASLRAMFPQVLITMMFLCLYEIIGKCDHRWVIHLEASQDIIRIGRERGFAQPQDSSNGLAAFAERFFAFQDSISVIACGKAPLFGANYWDNMENKRQVDSWMGCSPELAGILCEITELGRAKTAGRLHDIELLEHADAMEKRIHSLESVTQTPNDDELIWSAELKRLSALIYLHCVLYDATPYTPVVSQLVRQILEQILSMLHAGRARALTFPVFVTAVELNPTDDIIIPHSGSGEYIHGRRLILETLEAMSTDSLSNVTRIRAVVKKVWRLRDMHADDGSIHQFGLRSYAFEDILHEDSAKQCVEQESMDTYHNAGSIYMRCFPASSSATTRPDKRCAPARVARLLVEHGADPALKMPNDRNALHALASSFPSTTDNQCAEAGLIGLVLGRGVSVDEADNSGDTALYVAAGVRPRPAAVRTLLRHGAMPEVLNKAGDRTRI